MIKFWTKDRYFSDKNEKRIGRISFFLRMLFIFIMTGLLGMAINMWLMNLLGLRGLLSWPIVIIALTIIFIFSCPILAKKRSHDFNSDGKIASYIILWTLMVNLISNIITFYKFYTGSFGDILNPSISITILSYLSIWFGIASLITILILLFRPGTQGTNTYWEMIK